MEKQNSYQQAVNIVEGSFETCLDLGCWDKRLKSYLPEGVKYQGLDFEKSNYFQGEKDVINHDLEKGLPMFKDGSFDIVFILGVIQSLNNAHFVFKETQRVAKRGVVVSLTNMQYWVYRLKYLFGKYPVGSLKFFADPSDPKFLNRHKWLINYHQAIEFVKENSGGSKIIIANCIYNHQFLKPLNLIEKILSRIWSNMFVYIVTFYVQKQ